MHLFFGWPAVLFNVQHCCVTHLYGIPILNFSELFSKAPLSAALFFMYYLPVLASPINQSTNQPINQSTNQPINQSTNQPINQSTNQPINHIPYFRFCHEKQTFIKRFLHLPAYPHAGNQLCAG
jgi:PT repeat